MLEWYAKSATAYPCVMVAITAHTCLNGRCPEQESADASVSSSLMVPSNDVRPELRSSEPQDWCIEKGNEADDRKHSVRISVRCVMSD